MMSGSERAIGGSALARPWHGARAALNAVLAMRHTRAVLFSLLLVGTMTLCLLAAARLLGLPHVSIAYLIPVMVAATTLGLVAALIVAVMGVAASAFLFYPPIYDLRVSDPQHLVDLTLFVIVAVATSQLAAAARRSAARAEERESEIRALYNFSRRLAVATEPAEISAAIQEHLSTMTGRRVVYFVAGGPTAQSNLRQAGSAVPQAIQSAVEEIARGSNDGAGLSVDDLATGTRWLVRPVSPTNPAFGLLAIDMGQILERTNYSMQKRVDAALAEATATLERIDVAHAIGEAKLRAEAETLRAALIGSVSHELRHAAGFHSRLRLGAGAGPERRPGRAPGFPRRHHPRRERAPQHRHPEPARRQPDQRRGRAGALGLGGAADIVNAALARLRQRLSRASHRFAGWREDLPLVRIDPVLVEQALSQVIDNAAKYSPPGSASHIERARRRREARDRRRRPGRGPDGGGAGHAVRALLSRPRSGTTTHQGLGAGPLDRARLRGGVGGQLEAASEGAGRGATITMRLPAPPLAEADRWENGDE